MIRTTLTAAALAAATLTLTGSGAAHQPQKQQVCHKGQTLTISRHAVPAHLRHGDSRGPCGQPGGTTPPGTVPVTPRTFAQTPRVLACASKPVLRTADNTMGIAVDLDLATYSSGVYAGATFVLARFYQGVGATCDNLGGRFLGTYQQSGGYPNWTR